MHNNCQFGTESPWPENACRRDSAGTVVFSTGATMRLCQAHRATFMLVQMDLVCKTVDELS